MVTLRLVILTAIAMTGCQKRSIQTMSRYSNMTALGFENRAPSRRAKEIDSAVAERHPCRKCSGQMRYEPWVREGWLRERYIAYMVCEDCDHYEEF